MGIRARWAVAVVAITLMGSASAAGQTTAERVRLGAFGGLTAGNGGTGQSAGVTVTYRLAPRLLVEAEATYVTGLRFGPFSCWPPGLRCVGGGGAFVLQTQGVLLTGTLRIELPAAGRWLRPYVAAGGGYARFAHEIEELKYSDSLLLQIVRHEPMGTIGAGVLVPLSRRLVVRTDARYQVAFDATPVWPTGPGVPNHFQWVRVACLVEARF